MGEFIMKKKTDRNINLGRKIGNKQESGTCCQSPSIVAKEGNLVCIKCGIVVGKNLVNTEERAFSTDDINKRKRTEKIWREIGPRTYIGKERKDSKGNVLDAEGKTLFNRLDKIQVSLIGSIERNLWEARPQLNMLCSKLNIPIHIKETSWNIYKECAKKKLTMGRSIIGFVAASLYAAIRIHELPRILDEVCDSELVSRRTVIQALGLIVKDILPMLGLKYRPITSNQLIYKFGNELSLPMSVQKSAANTLEIVAKKGLSGNGKDPRGFAASALYLAAKLSDHRMTQAEVASVAKITEVTLRSRSKEIRKYLN